MISMFVNATEGSLQKIENWDEFPIESETQFSISWIDNPLIIP